MQASGQIRYPDGNNFLSCQLSPFLLDVVTQLLQQIDIILALYWFLLVLVVGQTNSMRIPKYSCNKLFLLTKAIWWWRTFVYQLFELFFGFESVMVDLGFTNCYEMSQKVLRIRQKCAKKLQEALIRFNFCSNVSNRGTQLSKYFFIANSSVKILCTLLETREQTPIVLIPHLLQFRLVLDLSNGST